MTTDRTEKSKDFMEELKKFEGCRIFGIGNRIEDLKDVLIEFGAENDEDAKKVIAKMLEIYAKEEIDEIEKIKEISDIIVELEKNKKG